MGQFPVGARVWRLTVIAESGGYRQVECDCGVVKWVQVKHLYKIKSCGCYRRDVRQTHGMYLSAEYRAWVHMRERCSNPNNSNYRFYGGVGITVCERWESSFVDFITDMGPKPSMAHILDRIDPHKGYSPDNCRWATKEEQRFNSRRARMLTFNGETKTVTEWAEQIGLLPKVLFARLDSGWPVEKALTTPFQGPILLTYQGVTLDLDGWSARLGVSKPTLYGRYQKGWTVEQILTLPLQRGKKLK